MSIKYLFFIVFTFIFFTSCQKEDFSQSGIIDDNFFLRVDEQNLPVRVAGNIDSKKILIIVHGGPGGTAIVYRDKYVIEKVEKEFAVVYWDQRFAGSAQGNGGDISVSMFREDLKKLILLLKEKYGAENKIYLMGHSWGGFVVPYFLIQENNQDLVDGWIQVDGAHNIRFNPFVKEMFLSYGAVEIAANRDTAFWQEVINYCESDQYKDDDYLVLLKLNNYGHRAGALYPLIEKPESAGYPNFINYSPLTAQSINSLNSVYFQAIFEAAFNDNPVVGKLDKIELPTLLLWGQHDFVCPLALKNDIRNNISSSDVNEYIFSGSAHSPMISEPEAFWTEVINWVNIH